MPVPTSTWAPGGHRLYLKFHDRSRSYLQMCNTFSLAGEGEWRCQKTCCRSPAQSRSPQAPYPVYLLSLVVKYFPQTIRTFACEVRATDSGRPESTRSRGPAARISMCWPLTVCLGDFGHQEGSSGSKLSVLHPPPKDTSITNNATRLLKPRLSIWTCPALAGIGLIAWTTQGL